MPEWATRPLAAVRPARLPTSLAPLTRRISTALSKSPSASVERLLAVHHAGAGEVAELLDVRGGEVGHDSLFGVESAWDGLAAGYPDRAGSCPAYRRPRRPRTGGGDAAVRSLRGGGRRLLGRLLLGGGGCSAAAAAAARPAAARRPSSALEQLALPLGQRLVAADRRPAPASRRRRGDGRSGRSGRRRRRRRRPGSAARPSGSRRRCPGSGSRPRPGRSWCRAPRSPGCPACGPRRRRCAPSWCRRSRPRPAASACPAGHRGSGSA